MSERGVFAVDRGVFDHAVLQERSRPYCKVKAWMWLVAEAAWKPMSVRVSGQWVRLERGELAHSVRFMADKWKWSKSRVHRFLIDLENESMIGTAAKTGITVISISKYDDYQRVSLPSKEENGTPSGTAAGQQRDKEEDIKNIKLAVAAGAREPLDKLETELRAAAGLENSTAPALLNLAPILGLMDSGASLHEEILPALREFRARGSPKKIGSWGFFVPAILERRGARKAASEAQPTAVQPRGKPTNENSISAARGRVLANLGLENVEPNIAGEGEDGGRLRNDNVLMLPQRRGVQP